MKRLSEKIKVLILDGVKTTGSFDPKETMVMFEEHLTVSEAEVIEGFMDWVNEDRENRAFGHGNIDARYMQYKNEMSSKSGGKIDGPAYPTQRQDSLTDQMRSVIGEANQIGCYDAADWIKERFFNNKGGANVNSSGS